MHLAGDLVPGDAGAAVLLDRLEDRTATLTSLHNSRHPLAPARVRHADDGDVVDAGMRLDGRLDLFGEDLLTARVDRHRTAAEQADAAVRLEQGQVTRHDVADALDVDEDLGRLGGVLVVAEWDVAGTGEAADLPRAGC